MHSVATPFGSALQIVYCFDNARVRTTELIAIVVWRTLSNAPRRTWRDALRAMRYRLGLGALQDHVTIGRNAGLWCGSAGSRGEQETLFHPVRRVVRVQGQEFPLPSNGDTLILMIDRDADAAQSIVARTLRAPLPPRPFLHQRICFGKRAQSHPFADAWQRAEWKQLLARDPLLHAFVGSINDAAR